MTIPATAIAIPGLLGIEALMPAHLFGGQAHRVPPGRLLLAHRHTQLLDEPFTSWTPASAGPSPTW